MDKFTERHVYPTDPIDTFNAWIEYIHNLLEEIRKSQNPPICTTFSNS